MVHVFGIRHHGPGSTKSLEAALATLEPDCLLIEGPPDANDAIEYVAHPDLQPPVALLVYNTSDLKQGAYYPFAHFSPEWQALKYGLSQDIPTEFMDLPRSYGFTLNKTAVLQPDLLASQKTEVGKIYKDPFSEIAKLAGYDDSERWWEIMFERSENATAIFDSILELMKELRAASPPAAHRELQREAYMRTVIRAAIKKGYQKIAVVCGAWHAPALVNWQQYKQSHDKQFLKGIKKTKTKATWVPWTYKRLSSQSGYAAGVISPAWYQLLYDEPKEVVIQWMSKVAHLLRAEDLMASSAHIIEAVRLAETLAALRTLAVPGIHELKEAAISIICNGEETPLALIEKKLIIGERIGEVPDTIPVVPLQQDLNKCIKSARLTKAQQSLEVVQKDLDLRTPSNLAASLLLHRLNILEIPWGLLQEGSKHQLGSFKEHWVLEWEPDFAIRIIEAGMWGNTVYEAASNFMLSAKDQPQSLAQLTNLVQQALAANLKEIIDDLIQQLNDLSTVSTDIFNLMDALPSLVNIVRYGSARQYNTAAIQTVIKNIVPRICIGLPSHCSQLDDEASQAVFQKMLMVNRALHTLNNTAYIKAWYFALAQIMNLSKGDSLSGLSTRILLDKNNILPQIAATKMSQALSKANAPLSSAKWIEGFLNGSGLLLIYNTDLWNLLDTWVSRLKEDRFMEILPILRRTFSQFAPPERQKMLDLVRQTGKRKKRTKKITNTLNTTRTGQIIPIVRKILNLD